MQAFVLAALAAGLVYVAVDDLRSFRIRNDVVALLLALTILHVAWRGGGSAEILARLLFVALVFAIFVAAFALGMMGGGDTKLLGVALLWVGPEWAVLFAGLLLLGAVLVAGLVRVGLVPSRGAGRRTMIPFGPVIAIAWMVTALLSAWP